MKKATLIFAIVFLIIGCSKQKTLPLNQRIEQFRVSECRTDCGRDSIGFWLDKEDNNLNIKLGYIVNCSWKQGYFKNISEKNDTLILEIDRPHSKNGEYTITDCDCFLFFEFTIMDYSKTPKSVRIIDLFDKTKFWDQNPIELIENESKESNISINFGIVPSQEKIEFQEPTILIVTMDSLEIEQVKKIDGEDNFYTASDDLMWYNAMMLEKMDSLNIDVKYTEKDTVFIKTPNLNKTIIKDSTFTLYTYFYFDGQNLNKTDLFKLLGE